MVVVVCRPRLRLSSSLSGLKSIRRPRVVFRRCEKGQGGQGAGEVRAERSSFERSVQLEEEGGGGGEIEIEDKIPPLVTNLSAEEINAELQERNRKPPPIWKRGQWTAVLSGVVAVILGVGYLFLASLLDSRELLPPPPEALGM